VAGQPDVQPLARLQVKSVITYPALGVVLHPGTVTVRLAKAGAELGDYGTPVIEGGLALGEMVLSRLERLQVYLGAVEHPGVNAIVEPHRRFVAF